jgi:hypothetical protein
MQKLELRAIEDELSRDGGNTLRRYLDDNLRKELGLPAKKRKNLTHAARKMQEKGFPRWNDSLQSFMVYHCGLHGFDPDPATIAGKCFERECEHLKLDKRKEITVTTLSEALTIKSQINSIYIEETKTGFRIFKK